MGKTPAEFETEFVQTTKEKTGKSLEEWLPVLESSGLQKQMELLNWLKKDHGLNHLQANLLAGIYRNGGKPVYAAEEDLLEAQFNKCESMRPLFTALAEQILANFPNSKVIPKKTYVSFTAVREFLAVNIKPQELRLGLDLGQEAFNELIQKPKLSGPMPRMSHMIVLKMIGDMDTAVNSLICKSYSRSHK